MSGPLQKGKDETKKAVANKEPGDKTMEKKRIFTSYNAKWGKQIQKERVLSGTLSVQTVERGILLPLRKRKDVDTTDGCHEGGVCTEKYEYVAGIKRDRTNDRVNYSCCRSYKPEKEPVWRDETVVFGGILYAHFGHMLIDGLSRMWWFAENPDTSYKIVFLMMSNQELRFPQFFELAGLRPEQYEIITEPTQFAKIIVPEEAMYALDAAHPQWLSFFERVKQNVQRQLPPSPHKKIYLTRTQLEEQDGINEEYYEDFYRELGYTVIAPEKLSLAEQINVVAGAEQIVATIGTLSHLAIFAQEGCELILLLKDPGTIIFPQITINALKKLDWCLIEATKDVLPTTHALGAHLYCNTEYFQEYRKSWNLEVKAEEAGAGVLTPELLMQYCKAWAEHYQDPVYFRRIRKKQMRDLLKNLNSALLNQAVDMSLYPSVLKNKEKELAEKEAEIQTWKEKCRAAEKELKRLKNSRSWKMTRFLRKGHAALKKCLAEAGEK